MFMYKFGDHKFYIVVAVQGCERVLGEGGRAHPYPQVKWCSAHVTIARQIQAHQQQAKVRPINSLDSVPLTP